MVASHPEIMKKSRSSSINFEFPAPEDYDKLDRRTVKCMYFIEPICTILQKTYLAVIITIQPWTVDQFECLILTGSLAPNLPQAGLFSVLSCTVPYRAVR